MWRQFFIQSPVLALPVLAMAIFMLTFAVVVFSTFRKKAQGFDPVAALPLDEETTHVRAD
jgi:hypothetical protein